MKKLTNTMMSKIMKATIVINIIGVEQVAIFTAFFSTLI